MEDYSNAISSQQTELLLKQLNNIIYSVPCSYHAVHCPGLCYTHAHITLSTVQGYVIPMLYTLSTVQGYVIPMLY